MNYLKKTIALMLVAVMVLSLAACGDDKKSSDGKVEKSKLYQKEKREIYIGSWYEQYYTSAHSQIEDNPALDDRELAEMNLNNMRTIEKKYNIELYYDVLTWDGCITSINTSIMAGAPDCDVYMVDLQFGIPAVLANYAYSLDYVLKESEEAKAGLVDEKYLDIFSEKGSEVINTLQFTADGQTYLFGARHANTDAYALGYNKDLIAEYGLEDPQELYEKGEWTWDKWNDMLVAITKDKDGDGATDQWGFRGAWNVLFPALMMSNNASIATPTPDDDGVVREHLTSNATTQALEQLRRMYQVDKVSFWDSNCDAQWNDNVYAFAAGNIGFWVSACWITQEADPDQNMIDNMGVVPWPMGPSGTPDHKNINLTTGTYWIIPANVENPALIYCVIYDYFNWFGEKTELRDDTQWAEQWSYNEKNFELLCSMADEPSDFNFELWDQVKWDDSFTVRSIIETGGEWEPCTVAEFQQANKNHVQDFLDKNFNK